MCRGFAYVDLISTDVKLGKCMNTLNGCSWKGGKLQISQAKPNRFKTLEDGRVSIINSSAEVEEPVKKPTKKRKLVRMAGDQSLVTDKNVEKRKGWRRGRYGRAIACLRIRKPNRQLLIIDPSHYKNNLEKLFGSIRPKPLYLLAWSITDIKKSDNEPEALESDEIMGSEPEIFEDETSEIVDTESSEAVAIESFEDVVIESASSEAVAVELIQFDESGSNGIIDMESNEAVDVEMSDAKVEEEWKVVAEDDNSVLVLLEENITQEIEATNEVQSELERKETPVSKAAPSIPIPEPKFEVNVNWSSLFAPSPSSNDSPLFGSSIPNQSFGGFSLNSLIENKFKTSVSAEEVFKKPVMEEAKMEICIDSECASSEMAASSTLGKKPAHNYANLFGDLSRITPTTATRFGMLLSQKEEKLQEWRIERVELKEDFKKRLAEGKRRNRRNKSDKVQNK